MRLPRAAVAVAAAAAPASVVRQHCDKRQPPTPAALSQKPSQQVFVSFFFFYSDTPVSTTSSTCIVTVLQLLVLQQPPSAFPDANASVDNSRATCVEEQSGEHRVPIGGRTSRLALSSSTAARVGTQCDWRCIPHHCALVTMGLR